MFNKPFKLACTLALVVNVVAVDVRADDLCGVIMDECPPGQLSAIDRDDRCESAAAQLFCYPENTAPPRAQLLCARNRDGFACSAWPKTADPAQPLSYRWSTTGNLQLAPIVSNPSIRGVRCNAQSTNGVVKLEITSPVAPHLSSTTTALLDCERMAP